MLETCGKHNSIRRSKHVFRNRVKRVMIEHATAEKRGNGMGETVESIVSTWLKANGYDGLCNDGYCGCGIGDLFPCAEPWGGCEPAKMLRCDACGEYFYVLDGSRFAECPECGTEKKIMR